MQRATCFLSLVSFISPGRWSQPKPFRTQVLCTGTSPLIPFCSALFLLPAQTEAFLINLQKQSPSTSTSVSGQQRGPNKSRNSSFCQAFANFLHREEGRFMPLWPEKSSELSRHWHLGSAATWPRPGPPPLKSAAPAKGSLNPGQSPGWPSGLLQPLPQQNRERDRDGKLFQTVSDQDAWDKIIAVPLWLRMSAHIYHLQGQHSKREKNIYILQTRYSIAVLQYYICLSSTFAPKPL